VVEVWKHCGCILYVGSIVVDGMLWHCDGYNGDCCMLVLLSGSITFITYIHTYMLELRWHRDRLVAVAVAAKARECNARECDWMP
jgi:hypothetical protein